MVKEGGGGGRKDKPGEGDGGDVRVEDERGLLRDEQELLLEEVELPFVRLDVALDGALALVAVLVDLVVSQEGDGEGAEGTHDWKVPGVVTFLAARMRKRIETTSKAGSS